MKVNKKRFWAIYSNMLLPDIVFMPTTGSAERYINSLHFMLFL